MGAVKQMKKYILQLQVFFGFLRTYGLTRLPALSMWKARSKYHNKQLAKKDEFRRIPWPRVVS